MKRYYALETNEKAKTAEIEVFGDIADGTETAYKKAVGLNDGSVSGVSLSQDLKQLKAKGYKNIKIRINSMGGYVNEGLAIYNILKNSEMNVETVVDGFCCSAATLVFAAGAKRKICDSALMMIHQPWGVSEGNADELRAEAEALDKMTEALVKIYTSSSDLTEAEVKLLLKANGYRGSWITPEEALEYGLATEIITGDEEENEEEPEEKTAPEENPEENLEGEDTGDDSEGEENTDEDDEEEEAPTQAKGHAKRYYSSARKAFFEAFIKNKNSETVKHTPAQTYIKAGSDEDGTADFDALCERVAAMLADAADKKRAAGSESKTQKTVWDAIRIK